MSAGAEAMAPRAPSATKASVRAEPAEALEHGQAAGPSTGSGPTGDIATRARRRRRAAVAARLLAAAPEVVAEIEWDTLDTAPPWLALDAVACARLQCRIGALLCQAELRLWIDRPRVAAARAAVGEAFWKALLARPTLPLPAPPSRLDDSAQVASRLQALGAAVLLVAAPAPLGRAVAPLLATPAPLELHPEAARQVLAAVDTLEAAP